MASLSLKARIAALEAEAGADKGLRHFATVNKVDYFEVGPGYSYVDTLMCCEGNNPTDRRAWSQDELAALCDEGYTVLVVHWTDHWRGTDEESR